MFDCPSAFTKHSEITETPVSRPRRRKRKRKRKSRELKKFMKLSVDQLFRMYKKVNSLADILKEGKQSNKRVEIGLAKDEDVIDAVVIPATEQVPLMITEQLPLIPETKQVSDNLESISETCEHDSATQVQTISSFPEELPSTNFRCSVLESGTLVTGFISESFKIKPQYCEYKLVGIEEHFTVDISFEASFDRSAVKKYAPKSVIISHRIPKMIDKTLQRDDNTTLYLTYKSDNWKLHYKYDNSDFQPVVETFPFKENNNLFTLTETDEGLLRVYLISGLTVLLNSDFKEVHLAIQDAYGRQNEISGLCADPTLVCQSVRDYRTNICVKYELPACDDSDLCTGLLYRYAKIGGCVDLIDIEAIRSVCLIETCKIVDESSEDLTFGGGLGETRHRLKREAVVSTNRRRNERRPRGRYRNSGPEFSTNPVCTAMIKIKKQCMAVKSLDRKYYRKFTKAERRYC